MRAHGRKVAAFALASALAVALAAPSAHAEGRIQKFRGSLGFGYAKLFVEESPGGSFSMATGVDYPIGGAWRTGIAFGYELLGGRIVERGSFAATLDYSMLEILALAHYDTRALGQTARISFGPGLFSARADLSTSAGGLSFSDLAVDELAPGAALSATLIQARQSPVRIGFELGGRVAFVESETWTLALARFSFHY